MKQSLHALDKVVSLFPGAGICDMLVSNTRNYNKNTRNKK